MTISSFAHLFIWAETGFLAAEGVAFRRSRSAHASSASKKTDYVVVGSDPGSKYHEGRSLGIAILDYTQFEKLVGSR